MLKAFDLNADLLRSGDYPTKKPPIREAFLFLVFV